MEARGPKQAITRARRIDADSFTAFDPDWGPAYCRRIVHIEARGGTIVAEDIRLAYPACQSAVPDSPTTSTSVTSSRLSGAPPAT